MKRGHFLLAKDFFTNYFISLSLKRLFINVTTRGRTKTTPPLSVRVVPEGMSCDVVGSDENDHICDGIVFGRPVMDRPGEQFISKVSVLWGFIKMLLRGEVVTA